jgi:hypothetical protein
VFLTEAAWFTMARISTPQPHSLEKLQYGYLVSRHNAFFDHGSAWKSSCFYVGVKIY